MNTEDKESEDKESEKEIKTKIMEEKSKTKKLDFTKFELQLCDILNSKNGDDSTLENISKQKGWLGIREQSRLEDDQELSYWKRAKISLGGLLQSNSSSKFRLLAISCISLKDIKYYKEISVKSI
ncbi:hypothetical protein F8M41_012195 [Gigaspora margarita]|uniref:Uncharacterized protein n=1 Tax=Gigaspora margarita TaxID=4874 RepID=A0A8H4AT73_GIGMA|nr:hypothetical protein F8M41_012195 [Gigaspora margarita]